MLATTICSHTAFAQEADSTGLPGDNFSLTGALEMFKKSSSPEQFEQLINAQDNNVNNLDLNDDGNTDYIKVIDKKDGDAHAFILQSVVSETENQDIAVIEVEKQKDGKAALQIVGDPDIYGEELIVEPTAQNVESDTPAKKQVQVNIWAWPSVRYVYGPAYSVWVSPWGWRARPVWYHPWHPVRWHAFYPYRNPYRNHYVVVHHHTVVHAHRVYTPVRTTSVTVQTRHQASVNNYRATRTTQTVTTQGRHGHSKTVRRTSTVHGKKATAKTARARKN